MLALRRFDRTSDELWCIADASFQLMSRHFENQLPRAVQVFAAHWPPRIEQGDVASFEHGFAAVLFDDKPAGDLAADQKLVGIGVRDMTRGDVVPDRRALVIDEMDVGERRRLELGAERLTSLRRAIVRHDLAAEYLVPIIKPIARMK